MSQREQPDRVCKRKKQGQVLCRGNSSGSVERSSDTSVPPSPLSCSDLAAVSSIPSESSSVASDISDITIVSPEGERSNSGENSSEPVQIRVAAILNNFQALGHNILGDLTDSDTTLEYPTMSDDERASERRSADHSASSINPEMRSMFREFFSEFNRSGLMSARPSSGPCESDMLRQIGSLSSHKDGMDIAKFIRKLEADLSDIGYPSGRWKQILLQKLQSKSASAIVAGIDRDCTSYDQLKEILIEALGCNLTALGAKLTTEFAQATKAMSPLETYVHLKSIVDSVDMMCHSKEELLLFMACATYRASRPVAQRALMDQREFTSVRDLNKFALSINTSESERPSHSGGRHFKYNASSSVECFKCHKRGHRFYECRSTVPNHESNSPPSNFSSRPQGIVCFTCHEPGHKSPDCPTRKSNESSDHRSDRNHGNNRAGVKKTRTFNTNWVSVENGAPHVMGFVNGTRCKIVPDTGAEISIVPGCLVYGDQLTGELVDVKGWDGRPVTLETAVVEFMFKSKMFSAKVAVAHTDSLCGCVLFSVPMETATAEQLLLDAASKSDVSGLGAGQLRDTRSIQPSTPVDAGSGGVVEEARSASSTPSINPEESLNVRVVTRSVTKKLASDNARNESVHVRESDPQPFHVGLQPLTFHMYLP